MRKIIIIFAVIIISLIALKTWGFGFGLDTVPVTDSQIRAVNAVLDSIQTTLTEELKNINTNLYNLLKLQYENFFRQNYQDKIIQTWHLKDRFDDYQALLENLSNSENQNKKIMEYIENAEFAGVYQTLTKLPDLVACLPENELFYIEEYVSSTFAIYNLNKYALDQLSFIPICEDIIFPDFTNNIVYQRSNIQPKGFLSGLFANILRPFSFGKNFMLAINPKDNQSFLNFTIVPTHNEVIGAMKVQIFLDNLENNLQFNIENNLNNMPDPRNVVIPVKQVMTDDGRPITLSYQTIVDFQEIYEHQRKLNEYMEQFLTDYDFYQAFATSTFTTSTEGIPEICEKLSVGVAKPLNPQIACSESLANFSIDLKKEFERKLAGKREILEEIGNALTSTLESINNLKDEIKDECGGYKEKLDYLEQDIKNRQKYTATVTVQVNETIEAITGFNINEHIEKISTIRNNVNNEYKEIIENVNQILSVFKSKGINVSDLLGALNLDFIGEIMGKLELHNVIIGLQKIDDLQQNIDNILESAGNITNALGLSINAFNKLRSTLAESVDPISNSVFVKDYFEIYGIRVEIENIKKNAESGCRTQEARRKQQKFYVLKGNNNYFSFADFQKNNRVIKKIESKQVIEPKKQNNFFQKLLAPIFSFKTMEINLR